MASSLQEIPSGNKSRARKKKWWNGLFPTLAIDRDWISNVINQQSYVQLLLWEQEIPWLFDVEKNVSVGKKTEDCENLFFEAIANLVENGHWSTDLRRLAWSKSLMVFTFNFPFICYLGRICQ